MPRKFKNGDLVRFAEYTNINKRAIIGMIKDYFGKEMGLNHYDIRALDNQDGPPFLRTARHIEKLSEEDALLMILERDINESTDKSW